MKILLTIAFIFALLSQSSKANDSLFEDTSYLNPIEKADRELSKIKIKFQSPLTDIDENLEQFKNLISLFEDFKKQDLVFTESLLEKVKNQNTLSGSELFILRRTITVYYKINKKILDFSKVYDFGGFRMSKTFANEEKNTRLIKAHLIWLTGHLIVLDHLEKMHHLLYEKDNLFRRIVKSALVDKDSSGEEGNSKTMNDILKTNHYAVEIGESPKFSQQINLVRSIQNDIKQMLSDEVNAQFLVDIVATNPTSNEIAQGKKDFSLKHYTVVDTIVGTFNKITGWLSKLFGNIAGAVKWRDGYLFNNGEISKKIRTKLHPLDILIEKSPFTLTDKFIPGHYGHVAVYLGTKAELEEIGMWNHPDIIGYQEDIEKGKVILEAVRSGVKLSTLEEFLNIDELTIMRKEDILSNPGVLIEQITRGMDQIGKAYDFNFDITTLDKIVCSELVYIMYGNTIWPTQYRLGRPSITPDDVAEILFYRNTKYKIIDFIVAKDNKKIETANIDYIANEMDYELRAANGEQLTDQNDLTNTYWKKETKCYRVTENGSLNDDSRSHDSGQRVCKVSYKEFTYEEKDSI